MLCISIFITLSFIVDSIIILEFSGLLFYCDALFYLIDVAKNIMSSLIFCPPYLATLSPYSLIY